MAEQRLETARVPRYLSGRSAFWVALAILLAIFWLSAMRDAGLPGLYMDAINPDYLVARWLNPELPNPVWVVPGPDLPLLGNLYHGTQNLYLGLATYSLLGTSVLSARITHALFGAACVVLVYMLLRRETGRTWLALATAASLATDMAFLASFRTQSYIILGGVPWLLAAVYLALPVAARGRVSIRKMFLSGLFMGLAGYAYFVHLFFLPVLAYLIALQGEPDGRWARIAGWGAGFVAGMFPYVVGYALMAHELGGWQPFVEWMTNALTGLAPMEKSGSYLDGLLVSVAFATDAIAGTGNESMIAGGAVELVSDRVRVLLVAVAVAICAVAGWVHRRQDPRLSIAMVVAAVLPISFIMLGAMFGRRLGLHHYTIIVVLGYFAIGMAAAFIVSRTLQGRLAYAGLALASMALVAANFHQQEAVLERVRRSGGSGMATHALTVLANAALRERESAVYYFPDWGFFMPFAFLTSNQVRYQLEVSSHSLANYRGHASNVRVVFWNEADAGKYAGLLRRSGLTDTRLYAFPRRDGSIAFYVLTGEPPRSRPPEIPAAD